MYVHVHDRRSTARDEVPPHPHVHHACSRARRLEESSTRTSTHGLWAYLATYCTTKKNVRMTRKNVDPAKKKQLNACFVRKKLSMGTLDLIFLFSVASRGRSPYYTSFQVGASEFEYA